MNKPDYNSVMLDLETMGTGPQAAVIQVGAVAFHSVEYGVDTAAGFLADVDLTSSLMAGGQTDASTVRWWRDRGGFPKTGPAKDIRLTLLQLTKWWEQYPNAGFVWAKGPSFDVAILEGYFRSLRLACPWKYSRSRDVRTVFDLAQEQLWEPAPVEVVHEARADCINQITDLLSALKVIRADSKN